MDLSDKEGDLFWIENDEPSQVKVHITNGELFVKKYNKIVLDIAQKKQAYNSHREVRIIKDNNKLGITIDGGLDCEEPVIISKIDNNSPAALNGNINLYDILVNVNGQSTLNKTHDDIVALIRDANDAVELDLISVQDKTEERQGDGPIDFLQFVGEGAWIPIKHISLQMGCVTRYQSGRNAIRPNSFHIFTPSSTVTLHCSEEKKDTLNDWAQVVADHILVMSKQEVERLKQHFDLEDLVYLGWVSELLPSSKNNRVWKQILLVLREEELEFYNKFPETAEEWQRSEANYDMCSITWKILEKSDVHETDFRPNSLLLQSATGGRHIISFEFPNVLKCWQRQLLATISCVVKGLEKRTFEARWNEQVLNFSIDLQRGFLIEDPSTQNVLWQKPFAQLHHSSDDGCSMLHLEFKNTADNTTDIQDIQLKDIHSALCTMEAFLKTKVADIADIDPDFLFNF